MRLVDRVAYINHDIDDALRAGVLREGDLPREAIAVLGDHGLGADRHARARPRRALGGAGDIVQGDEVGGAMDALRAFMFERVYLGDARAVSEHAKIERMMRDAVRLLRAAPDARSAASPAPTRRSA